MSDELRLVLRNDFGELSRIHPKVSRFLDRRVPPGAAHAVDLVLEELVTNVIRHAYDDAGTHRIDVRVVIEAGHVRVEVEDDGREFDPTASAPDVRLDAPLVERRPGGLGIHLVRTFALAIDYRREGSRNHVGVQIPLSAGAPASD